MNLKTFSDLFKNQETLIWKNDTSGLRIESFTGLHSDGTGWNHYEIEAKLFTECRTPKETLLDFLKAIEWLRKQPNVINVSLNINGELSQIGRAKNCEWYKLEPNITFQIVEKEK